MLIEGRVQVVLEDWLVKELEPISQAEPSVLATYVLALLRHDKPRNELIALCEEQLEDFLSDESKRFVASLFSKLDQLESNPPSESKSKDTPKDSPPPLATTSSPSCKEPPSHTEDGNRTPEPQEHFRDDFVSTHQPLPHSQRNSQSPPHRPLHHSSQRSISPSSYNSRNMRSRRRYIRSRSRSRSNSPRGKRSYSEDLSSRNWREEQIYSNKRRRERSPASYHNHFVPHPEEATAPYVPQFVSHPPRWGGMRREHRPLNNGNAMQSAYPHHQMPHPAPPPYPGAPHYLPGPPQPVSQQPPPRMWMNNQLPSTAPNQPQHFRPPLQQQPFPSPSPSNVPKNDTADHPASLNDSAVPGRQRCRSFDEQGICMLGDNCPYDHGSRIITPPAVENRSKKQSGQHYPFNKQQSIKGYDSRKGPSEDVTVVEIPRSGPQHGRRFSNSSDSNQQLPELSPEARSTTILVSSIPKDKNSIEHLNNHFKQFGTVVNIQVMPNLGKAFVQFSNNRDGYRALRSPEAVFSNRFIRTAWASPEDAKKAAQEEKKKSSSHSELVLPTKTSFVNQESVKAAKERQQEKMKELQNQTGDLTRKQITQSKEIIELLERNKNMLAEERASLLKRLDVLRSNIEATLKKRKQVTPTSRKAFPTRTSRPPPPPPRLTKEMLDQQLDELKNSKDTSEVQKHMKVETDSNNKLRSKVENLRAKALELGYDSIALSQMLSSLSNTIQINTPPVDLFSEKQIREHFKTFGSITSVIISDSIFVTFKEQIDASRALQLGKQFQEEELLLDLADPNNLPDSIVEKLLYQHISFEEDDEDALGDCTR